MFPRRERQSIDVVSSLSRAIDETDPDWEYARSRMRRTMAKEQGDETKEEENEEVVLKEIIYGEEFYDKDGVRRMRITRDNYYVRLEVGIRFKDNPDKFSVKRRLTFNMEELPKIKELLELIEE